MEAHVKLNALIPSPFPLARIPAFHLKRSPSPALSCLRKKDEFNESLGAPSQFKLESQDYPANLQNSFMSSNVGPASNGDIWKLFNEAQQNILHLNEQRMIAFEELKKMKGEKQVLLNKIEQLEAERHDNFAKDKVSVLWKWLLRIDSMVLKNMITISEATELRTLVIDSNTGIADIVTDVTSRTDQALLSDLRDLYAARRKNALHIIHICTEMEPVVCIGSLASYVTGLSRALQKKGNLVEVILPKYTCMELSEVQGLKETEADFYSYFDGEYHANRISTGVVCGVGVTFIQPVKYSSFFDRERIYGYADDFERFSYFSRASLDYILKSGKRPDVLHIHNWETAIVGPLFWDIFVNQGLERTRIMLTCHTFDSQCHTQPEKLAMCGLDPSRLHRPDRLQHNTKMHVVDVLKGGVVYSNKVAVISSFDLKSKRSGRDLESTLSIYTDKLFIAPCGFDDSLWDPSKDKFLPVTYTADNLEGKAVCKITLQQRLGLSEHASTPTIGCIFSDLPDHDVESLQAFIWIASRRGCQLIIMTDNKASNVNRLLESLKEFKDPNVRIVDKYDEAFSHLVFAGSDVVLCSSFDDPVLQVPLKAIKYGAAPIAITMSASRTRNLADNEFGSTKYSQYVCTTFANMSLNQALDELQHNPVQWNHMIMDAMRKDFSWNGECCDLHISAYTSLKNL
uniref:starch synthase n=1 Tax=Kalanchoe fedtschenkoi TaxID=63787 RepID=A0A7N0USB8_KALFE